MDYSVKNLKTLSSGAYTASLYEGGKRVAVIEDDGRGGAPYIRPIKAEGYGKEMRRLEAALTEVDLPDWYLTTHGRHARLDPHWELAIGYLIESFENDKIANAKPGRVLFRTPDGGEGTGPERHPSVNAKGNQIWRSGDWVAA